jgi:hypothetical protein
LLDEVRIYSKALSLVEIQDLYAAAPANIGPVISSAGAAPGIAGQPFALTATVSDDGNPGPLTLGWSTLSGPGSVAFGNPSAASTTAICSTGGLFTLRLTASDGAITTMANLTADVGGQTYESWAAQSNLNGGNAAATANPMGDGISNLMKYALGLPADKAWTKLTDGVNPGLPVLGTEGSSLTLTYQRDTAKMDVAYSVEASDDLASWSASGVSEQVMSTNGTILTVKAAIPMGNNPRQFLRLRITK